MDSGSATCASKAICVSFLEDMAETSYQHKYPKQGVHYVCTVECNK